ncbi:MAG: J domain-containing protein [Patescibacteria group bacterium]|nr:J domain-containing protein [Patescibacteria group bacterium]
MQKVKLSREENEKKQLHLSIVRKRKLLENITEKVEVLRMELDLIKDEYNARIGKLYLKDNTLDLEIIRYRHISSLIEQGHTFGEAVKEIEDGIINQLLEMQQLEEEIHEAEAVMQDRQKVEASVERNIKKLWKQLILKFHPDLVTDPSEKAKREEIIKKINNAYKENDFKLLQILESKFFVDHVEETSVPMLEKTLADIENMIVSLKQQYKELRASDWFGWRIKLERAKKKHIDIFADLERSLLDDIVRKISILNSLKVKVGDPLVF